MSPAPSDPPSDSDPDFSLRRIAVPAFGPAILFGVGEGAILPIVPLMAIERCASVAEAALIVTSISIGSLIANIPASVITMRWGERWAIFAAGLWSALGMAFCILTPGLWLFGAGCFMVGTSQAVYNLARQSYLTDVVPAAHRARALSTLGGSMRIGMFIGPMIASAGVHWLGLSAAFGVGIVAVIAAAVIGLRVPDLAAPSAPGDAWAPEANVSIGSTLAAHRRLFFTLGLAVLVVSAVRSARQTIIPLWADEIALAPAAASLIYGIAGGVDMLLFYPAGRLMDVKGRRWVALPAMVLMGLALLAMPLTHGFWGLLAASVLAGVGNGIGSGLNMTLGADHAPRHGRAYFLGIWRFLGDVGSSCGPALLSLLTGGLSLASGIFATGLLSLAGATMLARWVPRRNP